MITLGWPPVVDFVTPTTRTVRCTPMRVYVAVRRTPICVCLVPCGSRAPGGIAPTAVDSRLSNCCVVGRALCRATSRGAPPPNDRARHPRGRRARPPRAKTGRASWREARSIALMAAPAFLERVCGLRIHRVHRSRASTCVDVTRSLPRSCLPPHHLDLFATSSASFFLPSDAPIERRARDWFMCVESIVRRSSEARRTE